jgi:hypothetical protein
MASTTFNCNVLQGFNFERNSQCIIGHMTSLKIGVKTFAKDIKVIDPISSTSSRELKVVGVVSSIFWNGGNTEPLSINCQVSTVNKQDTVTLLHSDIRNTTVEYSFVIYDYDPVAKSYYKSFYNNSTTLKGLVEKSGGELYLGIDMEQSMEAMSPPNYSFYISIMPQNVEQQLNYGVSTAGKFTKTWGMDI